jgi:hypothetical protein
MTKRALFGNSREWTELTFEELLEFRLVNVVGDIPNKELMGVWVPHHAPHLRLTRFALAH